MPETSESTTFARPVDDVFAHLADFSRLAEWDPMFERSERADDGPLGVGSRFHTVGSAAGSQFELELEIVEYDPPSKVAFVGQGDGLSTREEITVAPHADGSQVTYWSSFETDKPDLVDAMAQPAFVLVGKRAMSGMRDWLGTDR